jgi:hypothetical protein
MRRGSAALALREPLRLLHPWAMSRSSKIEPRESILDTKLAHAGERVACLSPTLAPKKVRVNRPFFRANDRSFLKDERASIF